jgi:serine/threonine protein kinase/tetratricopeptide (TPR) repeat protein
MDSKQWQKVKELFSATLDLPLNERGAFLENVDEAVRVEVEKLLSNFDDAEEFINEPAVVEFGFDEKRSNGSLTGKKIDDYLILEEIGSGGMGAVYLAEQQSENFSHRVALKLIKRGMDTNSVLKRFMTERQILANLEHPNIARFLDGGTTADDVPYFVMEYVEGLPIKKYCDAHALDTAARLELFRKVCAAVSFAHQNLIVHRDLKPSNILVTETGEPKLLDFGIAKLLNPDWALDTAEATATMFRVMTPEYASPEQLRGLPVTTASDVYSLGVVLYELLTGARPFKIESRAPDEIAQIVLTEEPVKPSAIQHSKFKIQHSKFNIQNSKSKGETESDDGRITENAGIKTNPKSKIRNPKSLRGDLDNIILKALRKEPERRYQSVQEFSEDLRRHLAGLPVSATADTVSYRISKFVGRHRAGVFAAALVVLTLIGATGVTAWQAYRADRERARAEQRFRQVRKLANLVVFDYHDGIEKLAGSTAIREKMVKDALEYLDNLSAESGTDADLQRELAAAYQKVADVQGSPYQANLGNSKGALESYKKALAIREKLNAGAKENAQFKLDLIQSYSAVGELSQVTGNLPEALENYRKAFALGETLPESAESKRARAVLFRQNARALGLSGKLAEGIEEFKKSINVSNELISAHPTDASFKRELGLAYVYLGEAQVAAGDLKGALETERTAYALLESLISPNDAQSRREANIATSRIARILGSLGDKKGALETALKSLAIDEELLKADPSNSLARRDASISYYKVAQSYMAVGDPESAISNFRKAIALGEANIAANPLRTEMRGDLVVYLYWLGVALENNKRMPEALEIQKKVLAIQRSLADAEPTNTLYRGNLAVALTRVGEMSLKLGRKTEALEGLQKALAIREELVAANPEYAVGRGQLAYIYKGLGNYFSTAAADETDNRAGNWRQAKDWYRKSLAIWTDLQQKKPLDNDDAKEPADLNQKIQQCERALAKIKENQ